MQIGLNADFLNYFIFLEIISETVKYQLKFINKFIRAWNGQGRIFNSKATNSFVKRTETKKRFMYAYYKPEAYSRNETPHYDCFQLTTLIFKLFLMFMHVLSLATALKLWLLTEYKPRIVSFVFSWCFTLFCG